MIRRVLSGLFLLLNHREHRVAQRWKIAVMIRRVLSGLFLLLFENAVKF
jgi:hypothetical protein